jgi:hypothetical protein
MSAIVSVRTPNSASKEFIEPSRALFYVETWSQSIQILIEACLAEVIRWSRWLVRIECRPFVLTLIASPWHGWYLHQEIGLPTCWKCDDDYYYKTLRRVYSYFPSTVDRTNKEDHSVRRTPNGTVECFLDYVTSSHSCWWVSKTHFMNVLRVREQEYRW